MAYSRNWLKTQITSYIKDSSLGAELDVWIDLAAKRVSAVLECWEMESELANSLVPSFEAGSLDGGMAVGTTSELTVDGGDAFAIAPEEKPLDHLKLTGNVIRILGVQYLKNNAWYNLRAMPKHDAAQFKRAGLPQVYLVEQRKIFPLPFMEGDFKAQVLTEVVVPVGDGEVDALTSYPFIFLNACLAEAADWKQDGEMAAKFEEKWQRDAMKIKSTYLEERTGETPTMRAI